MLKLPDNLIRVAEARAPEVPLVPGGYFFSRLIQLPPEVTHEEFSGLAELTLEECAPFPLDQLAWGFMADDVRRELWVYAACRPRIGAGAMDSWDDAEHVFPAFLPLVLAFPKPPKHLVWKSEQEIMLLEFADGARFPSRIRHRKLTERDADTEGEGDLDPAGEVAEYLRNQGLSKDTTPVYTLSETLVGDDRQVSFIIRRDQEDAKPEPPVVLADAEASWWADLRSPDFIASEQRSRRWQNHLWASLQWATWATVALILLVLFNIVGSMLIKRREALIIAQAPSVVAVEQNSEFLNDLRQFSERPLRPYEVLGITNENRPIQKIWYSAAEVDTTDGVTIQGFANSVNEVNEFARRLIATNKFKQREAPRYRKKGNQTLFTLKLDYIGSLEDSAQPLAANDQGVER
ncbi:hypothetical protein [Cerasicoccus arenae]|uniref:Uncharacterized protein n=1 Tax=Cerasicoccus arenae TaxID=424488 RepID=A0A8J3DEP9_9BACT|nr:hypothetical protein [Cerasicoccus arenae]MBK1857966.1 hypothetical protein [Cerasicoccus arenae]GHB97774.1 hypothetical protein GCM10007047_12070 [Cerasicoccus arenae]